MKERGNIGSLTARRTRRPPCRQLLPLTFRRCAGFDNDCPDSANRRPGFKNRCPESKTSRPGLGNDCPDFANRCPGSKSFRPGLMNRCPGGFRLCPDFQTFAPVLKVVAPISGAPRQFHNLLPQNNLCSSRRKEALINFRFPLLQFEPRHLGSCNFSPSPTANS